MASTCLSGQTGPLSSLAGFGTMAAAMSGFFYICGWPDRAPSGPFGAYTDYVSPALLPVRAAGRAGAPAPHRSGPVHRLLPERGLDPQPLADPARLRRQRSDRRADGQRRRPLRPPRRLPQPRRRPVDRRRVRDRRAVARARARCSAAGPTGWRTSTPGSASGAVGSSTSSIAAWTATRSAERRDRGAPGGGRARPPGRQLARGDRRPAAPAPPATSSRSRTGSWARRGWRASRFTLSRTPAVMWRAGPTFGEDTSEILADDAGLRRRPHRRAGRRRHPRVALHRRSAAGSCLTPPPVAAPVRGARWRRRGRRRARSDRSAGPRRRGGSCPPR